MTNQLGKEKSSEKNLESKFDKMQKDVQGIKKDEKDLLSKTTDLEQKEQDLEAHDKNYRKELNNLENKNGMGGWVDSGEPKRK